MGQLAVKPIIGLEIHCQLNTQTKLFCDCSNTPLVFPNSVVCPVCLGYPGTLPVLNKAAVIKAIDLALALKMPVNRKWEFARKSYFYPDLPKGYQITMHEHPVAQHGVLRWCRQGRVGQVGIDRIHLEEDAGRLIHHESFCPENRSLVDYNRAGVPLIEMVTLPELKTIEDVIDLVVCYQSLLKFNNISDAEMAKGNLRVDVNVSIQIEGRTSQPTEIKNLNSFRSIKKAISQEVKRQNELMQNCDSTFRQTMRFDPKFGKAVSIRPKEALNEYKLFIEPDIPEIIIDSVLVAERESQLLESPDERYRKLHETWNLNTEHCDFLVFNPDIYDYFCQCLPHFSDVDFLIKWLIQDFRLLQIRFPGAALPDPQEFCHLLNSVLEGRIHGSLARKLLTEVFEMNRSLSEYMNDDRFQPITDMMLIESLVQKALEKFPRKASELSKGRSKLTGFFISEVRKQSADRIDPKLLSEVILKLTKTEKPENGNSRA